jgi:hypothetical protein
LCPQLVDNEGRIRSAYNFDWTDLPMRERLSELAPTTIESDVRAGGAGGSLFRCRQGAADIRIRQHRHRS